MSEIELDGEALRGMVPADWLEAIEASGTAVDLDALAEELGHRSWCGKRS
jgi:hypothetical protein